MPIVEKSQIWAINAVALPQPSKSDVRISGLQKFAERTEDGLLHKETVAFKRTVSVSYEVLSQEEYQGILNSILSVGEWFTLKYLDPQKGVTTMECYVNELSNELYSAVFYNGLWRNVQFNCIER